MTHPMVNETFENLRSRLAGLLQSFQSLVENLGNAELARVVSDLRTHISEPALFVVVGEIKAGKSSFVNALLGESVCAVDPAPCTDVIQQIVYAPERFESDVSENIRRIGLPVDILKQIAVVDTPGTNTIIAHHQEITERFIPNSALVLFVFPAKNPHTRSAWDLLDQVTEAWRKRVVFVLQQADLATDQELSVNLEKVREYAADHNVAGAKIFATSAVREAAGQENSGFEAIRTYIHDHVVGGRHLHLKLRSTMDTCGPILERVMGELARFKEELARDQASAQEIQERLAAGRRQAERDGRFIVDRLLERYDKGGQDLKEALEQRLSASSLFQKAMGSVFRRKSDPGSWVEDLQKNFESRLMGDFEEVAATWSDLFNETFKDLSTEIIRTLETMAQVPGAKERLLDLGREKDDLVAGIRRKIAQQAGEDFFASALRVDPSAMGTHLVGGSALTLVGALLLATTHVAFLDVTGGILTGTGLFLAGGALVLKRGKIRKEMDNGLARGREEFEHTLIQKMSDSTAAIFQKIEQSLSPLLDYVQKRQEELAPLTRETEAVRDRMIALVEDVDREMKS